MTYHIVLDWIDGPTGTIRARPGETVLAAAKRANAGLPYGCQTGACATCVGRLVTGDLDHRRPPRALKDRHLDAGYALLCIAEPRTDCRIEVGAAVQASLVSNPWK